MTKKSSNNYALKTTLGNAVTLSRWLAQQPLTGQRSRQRSHFLNYLDEAVKSVEAERLNLLRGYAEKDEDGLAKTFEEDGVEQFDITDENRQRFNDDLQKFIDKEHTITFSEEDNKLFEAIKDLLEKTDYKFAGQMATEYDKWCASFGI